MADEFRPATGDDIEYKAFVREFEHPEEDDESPRRSVLYVVSTLTKPDSGWTFVLVPQADEIDTWRLLEDEPAFRDGDRSFFIVSGSSDHEIDKVPKTIRVIIGDNDVTRVSVVPWD